mmetsp:Transcript_49834/g.128216  ORF Transcript_49834/g.128216 Transcript_49834/m.128216 type:complete len:234 (-) Transcript_49834:658-1359(-)
MPARLCTTTFSIRSLLHFTLFLLPLPSLTILSSSSPTVTFMATCPLHLLDVLLIIQHRRLLQVHTCRDQHRLIYHILAYTIQLRLSSPLFLFAPPPLYVDCAPPHIFQHGDSPADGRALARIFVPTQLGKSGEGRGYIVTPGQVRCNVWAEVILRYSLCKSVFGKGLFQYSVHLHILREAVRKWHLAGSYLVDSHSKAVHVSGTRWLCSFQYLRRHRHECAHHTLIPRALQPS